MRSYFGIIVLAVLLGLSHRATSAPLFDEFHGVDQPGVHKILQYIDGSRGEGLVILEGGADEGYVEGTTFKTYRIGGDTSEKSQQPVWIKTGELKAVDVQAQRTIAKIVVNASELSRAFFPKFPGVMAGDLAVSQRLALVRRQVMTPTATISFFKLFEDPKSDPASFELTADGRKRLMEEASAFAAAKLSLLMVEGYTDHNGSTSANQVESYQRAMTVRQFLIEELGFDPDRVVAVGYGETEQVDVSLAPGYVEANRRIVLKAIPVTAH